MYVPMLTFDREAITIDLGPELLPSPRRVRQGPQTEHERRPLLPPLAPRAAQPHLHQRLARRLRHAAANRQPAPHPPGIVHPPLLVAEVGHRLVQVLPSRLAQLPPRQSLQLRQDGGGRPRLVFQPVAAFLQPLPPLAEAGRVGRLARPPPPPSGRGGTTLGRARSPAPTAVGTSPCRTPGWLPRRRCAAVPRPGH